MIPKCFWAIRAAIAQARSIQLRQMGLAAGLAGGVVFSLVNVSLTLAQSSPPDAMAPPSFEVAAIKPDLTAGPGPYWNILPSRFIVKGATTKILIAYAYNVRDFQESGGPSWMNTEKYDIDAKVDELAVAKLQKLSWEQYRQQYGLLVQSLLVDRFNLKVSHETKEPAVYALVIAKNGPKLTLSKGVPAWAGPKRGPWISTGRDQINAAGLSVRELADRLSGEPEIGDRIVLDQTGLTGKYDIALKWVPDQSPAGMVQGPDGGKPAADNSPPPESSGPSFFTAIQEQLGLKLEATKGPVEIIVIDHLQRPSEN